MIQRPDAQKLYFGADPPKDGLVIMAFAFLIQRMGQRVAQMGGEECQAANLQ